MVRKCLFCILLFIGIVHFSLGEEIDREERGKYQLFQDIKGFQSTVLRIPNDRYTLNLSCGNEKTGELRFARSQQSKISIKSCGKHIDSFEEIQSQKNQKASAATKEKNFYITPRIGLSTLTGLIGIELQYKHFAFDIGYFIDDEPPHEGEDIHHFLMYGIKYYFKSHHSTWYFGLGAVTNLDEDELGIGFIFGYRWRWRKGWDFNLGIGAGFPIGKDGSTFPMFDFALGYSF